MQDNKNQQGVDKAPGEEQGKGEKVSNTDLKGKKVDRDITDREDDPVKQKDAEGGPRSTTSK